jgi:D-alanine-D-alanine ligase
VRPVALVLGGGPDAEREVSIQSSRAVADALDQSGQFAVEYRLIDAPAHLRDLPGDVLVPVLHGGWGEGGPLQDIMEHDGRPYVGCGPTAARLCMDKMATKLAAARLGIATAEAAIVNPRDPGSPLAPPAVVKPVHDGSSVGLHMGRDASSLRTGLEAARADTRAFMIERLIPGRELTCGLLDTGSGLRPLPLIEIIPSAGPYDYAAKYQRDDTRYVVNPDADAEAIGRDALALAGVLGVRHLARADFLLDARGTHWLLEINTMPGFTGHSLLPKAAGAIGIAMPALCAGLCRLAMEGRSSPGAYRSD